MKVAFRLTLALIATFGASGCRTAGLSPSARPTPAVVPEPKSTFHLDEFIEDHNRNADRIESLTSKASITGSMESPDTGEVATYATSGRLSMLRPKNFKLELYGRMSTVADIGSNADRFWFWLDTQRAAEADKHVYYCDYENLPTANLAGTYQPDWIVDALGFRPITADEAATVRVSPGPRDKTTKLTFPASGEPSSYTRVMLVSDVSRRIVEYRVLDRDGRKVIGQADVKLYKDVTLKEETESESGKAETCYVPESLKLNWVNEKLSLDILLKDLAVNPPFSAKMKANFVEPTHKGYTPLDLAEATRNAPRTGGEMTAVRETLPPPERSRDLDRGWGRERGRTNPSTEIQGAEPAVAPESRRISTPTSARSKPAPGRARPKTDDKAPAAELDPILLPVLDDVVGAARPQPPGTSYRTTDSAQLLGGATFAR